MLFNVVYCNIIGEFLLAIQRELIDKITNTINSALEQSDISKLNFIYQDLVHLYETHYLEDDQDFRPASETYGIGDDKKNLANLEYISDRWGCSFRVRWMIELINPNYVLYEDLVKRAF